MLHNYKLITRSEIHDDAIGRQALRVSSPSESSCGIRRGSIADEARRTFDTGNTGFCNGESNVGDGTRTDIGIRVDENVVVLKFVPLCVDDVLTMGGRGGRVGGSRSVGGSSREGGRGRQGSARAHARAHTRTRHPRTLPRAPSRPPRSERSRTCSGRLCPRTNQPRYHEQPRQAP